MRFYVLSMLACLLLASVGCGPNGNTNVIENADQAAIDAYDKQIAENDAAMGEYKDIK